MLTRISTQASPSAHQEHGSPGPNTSSPKDSPGRNERSEKGHFRLFGKRSRTNSDHVPKNDSMQSQQVQASAVPKHLLPSASPETAYESAATRALSGASTTPSYAGSRFSSMSASTNTTQSSYEPPETPDFNPWLERGSHSTSSSTISRSISKASSPAQTVRSSGSIHRVPGSSMSITGSMTGNPKDLLPSEANKYAGFCKGAWRASIGDRKKAM